VAILVTLTIGLVEWIVLWAFNVKSLDSFLIAVALVLVGVTIHLTLPYVNRLLKP
jgi:hypothetical protein